MILSSTSWTRLRELGISSLHQRPLEPGVRTLFWDPASLRIRTCLMVRPFRKQSASAVFFHVGAGRPYPLADKRSHTSVQDPITNSILGRVILSAVPDFPGCPELPLLSDRF